jgi:hypothetical protein
MREWNSTPLRSLLQYAAQRSEGMNSTTFRQGFEAASGWLSAAAEGEQGRR